MTQFRCLVIGKGSAGQRWHRIISRNFPEIELTFLSSREFIAQIGSKSATQEFLRSSRPDVAIVANPSSKREFCPDFLRAGVDLFIEKPISDNISLASDIYLAAQSSGSVLQIGYDLRFLDVVQDFRRLISSERIGRIQTVKVSCSQYLPTWRPDTDYRKGVSARRELGGGVLNELSHELDLAEYFFGSPVAVSCRLHKLSDLEIDVEDYAELHVEYLAEEGRAFPVSIRLDFGSTNLARYIDVRGSAGRAHLDLLRNLYRWSNSGFSESEESANDELTDDEPYLAEITEFFRLVDGNRGGRLSSSNPLSVSRLVAAARLSNSKGGERIEIRECP